MKNGRPGAGILEQFAEVVSVCDDQALAAVLKTLSDLFAPSPLEADGRWFLESGYVAGAKAKAIRTLVNGLCREVCAQAIPLVDACDIPYEIPAAPIAVAVGHASTMTLEKLNG